MKTFANDLDLLDAADKVLIIDSAKFIELWKNGPNNHEQHLVLVISRYGKVITNFTMQKKDFPLVSVTQRL